jgi:flagellar basal-body rod protein FlgC
MIDFLPGITCTASALNAERIRMEVVGQNIANLNTTRGPDGQPYRRQEVTFASVLQQRMDSSVGPQAVTVSRISHDNRPPKMVHRPGHPDADGNDMVAMPNINMHEEMADLMTASRAFEANLAVMKNARSLTLQTLSIGRR